MYFGQEYIAPGMAVLISAGFALAVIGVLAITLLGVWLALGGVLLPATAILAVTLTAAIWPALQGILLTVTSSSLPWLPQDERSDILNRKGAGGH